MKSNGACTLDLDGIVTSVTSHVAADEEPFIALLLSDPRGTSFSARLDSRGAQIIGQQLLQEAGNIKDDEAAFAVAASQEKINLDDFSGRPDGSWR